MIGREFAYDVAPDGRQVFHGVMDEAAAGHLATLYTCEPTRDLTVDLSEVDFVSSIAIGALVKAQQRARDLRCELHVVTAEGSIAQRVLTITGVPHESTPHPPHDQPRTPGAPG